MSDTTTETGPVGAGIIITVAALKEAMLGGEIHPDETRLAASLVSSGEDAVAIAIALAHWAGVDTFSEPVYRRHTTGWQAYDGGKLATDLADDITGLSAEKAAAVAAHVCKAFPAERAYRARALALALIQGEWEALVEAEEAARTALHLAENSSTPSTDETSALLENLEAAEADQADWIARFGR